MNRLSKIINSAKEVKSSWEQAFLRNQEHLITGGNVLDEPYKKSDMVYICISTTARAISQVPLKVFAKNKDGMFEPIEDDPIAVLLRRPNYLMDSYSFVESVISWLMLKGGVFIIPFPPKQNGIPDSLWVVPPDNMSPIKDGNSGYLAGWNYSPYGMKQNSIRLSASEVCHTWFWNPFDPFKGFSPLEAGKIPILTDYQAAMYNQLFFKQGASSSGAFSTASTLTDKQYQRLREQIDSRYSGYKNAHRDMLLEKGLTYTSMTRTHRDMEFREGRKYDAGRIMQIFGMKKSIISVVDDVNKATARVDEKNWWKSTNLPMMKLVASALNFMFYRDVEDRQLYFDISSIEALHEDFSEKVRTGEKLLKMGFTGNEINQKLELGFGHASWRDYAYIPMTNVPVGADMPPQRPEGKETKNAKIIEVKENEPMLLTAGIDDSMPGSLKSNSKGQVNSRTPLKSDDEQIWKSTVRNSVTLEKTFMSKTKRAFLEMRKLALTWLYGQSEQKVVPKPFVLVEPMANLVDLSAKPMERLKSEADRLYQESLMTGLKSISTELGVGIDMNVVATPEAIAFLTKKTLRITKVGDTVNRQVGQSIISGMEKGETVDQIANRIKHVFNSGSKRAKTIARTEIFGAINHGRHEAIKQTRFQRVKWFTALDEKVRPGHANMHGRTKQVDESWDVAGESLRHPGDPAGSAGNIINCRCIEIVDLDSTLRADPNAPQIPQEELKSLKKTNGFKAVSDNRVSGAMAKCYL